MNGRKRFSQQNGYSPVPAKIMENKFPNDDFQKLFLAIWFDSAPWQPAKSLVNLTRPFNCQMLTPPEICKINGQPLELSVAS